jgi:tRNA U34 5-carboxymethylaminomethyl modifying GTPase MnmE/TrmE
MRKPRILFEQALKEKMQRLQNKVNAKQEQKRNIKENEKKKGFEKFYEMSYNDLRQEAKELGIITWRKTKEEILEELIREHKRLH